MVNRIHIKVERMDEFLKVINDLKSNETRSRLSLFLEKEGFDFLDVVQDFIIMLEVVDTRRLLNSFDKEGDGNIWTLSDTGLSLEVGTNVEYARYVNDGHWTVTANSFSGVLSDGTIYRWVPGHWQGDRFIYQPGADTGMVLKRKWVEGRQYFDKAIKAFENIFQQDFQRFVDNWIDEKTKGW